VLPFVRVRVATWNIKHGHPDPERLASVVRALADVDVLALQEVDVGVPRSGGVDQVAVVADALGMASVFGRALTTRQGGDYGNALLVRGDLHVDHVPLEEAAEQDRCALVGRAEVREATFSVLATHLSNIAPTAQRQLRVVLDALAASPAPRVLLGDLNLTPRRLPGDMGMTLARGWCTFPRTIPRKRIDHVAVSPDVRIVRGWVRNLRLSDHRALVADLDVRLCGDERFD
jgi:endonuclease/exonuclease/phosphatase family metal-dependent hydrolase